MLQKINSYVLKIDLEKFYFYLIFLIITLKYETVFEFNISIDESMIPYYGRHPVRQFIRNKPLQWGYKIRIAASPEGYAFVIDVYQGQQVGMSSEYKAEFGFCILITSSRQFFYLRVLKKRP